MNDERSTQDFYDQRYARGYQDRLVGYEAARWNALEHFIPRVARPAAALDVVDYGCGSGLFSPLWAALFPQARLAGCDISPVALQKLEEKLPGLYQRLALVKNNTAELPPASFDLCVSIEVMEHVLDLPAYLADVCRLLRPGGMFVWTTPCANRFSIEHAYARLTDNIARTGEGAVRWKFEDPAHLRRLTSVQAEAALRRAGFVRAGFRFRAHLFSFVCDRLMRRLPAGRQLFERAMRLDYALFRRLPNGASMLGWAIKG